MFRPVHINYTAIILVCDKVRHSIALHVEVYCRAQQRSIEATAADIKSHIPQLSWYVQVGVATVAVKRIRNGEHSFIAHFHHHSLAYVRIATFRRF